MDKLIEAIPYVAALITLVVILIRYQQGRDTQHAATVKAIVDQHDKREEKGQELTEQTNMMLGKVHESLNNNTQALNRIRDL
jgi:hypothetical protein